MTITMQNNIKRHLSAQNMTAAELERRTGIPHAVVNILHGRSKNPSLKTAQAIAKELGCSLEELLNEDIKSKSTTNAKWQPELYKAAFEAVYNGIASMKAQPELQQISECINEVYSYTLAANSNAVDLRFVDWILRKQFI